VEQKTFKGILCGLLAFCLYNLVEGVGYVGRRVRFETIAAVLPKIQVPYDVAACLFVNVIDVSKNLCIYIFRVKHSKQSECLSLNKRR